MHRFSLLAIALLGLSACNEFHPSGTYDANLRVDTQDLRSADNRSHSEETTVRVEELRGGKLRLHFSGCEVEVTRLDAPNDHLAELVDTEQKCAVELEGRRVELTFKAGDVTFVRPASFGAPTPPKIDFSFEGESGSNLRVTWSANLD